VRERPAQFELPPEGVDLETVERMLVAQALERTGWNQTQAARLLGLNRDQIHYRIEKFKLAPEKSRQNNGRSWSGRTGTDRARGMV
jgi:transcriptional regulator with GAF, ATPase, and Fis domain